MNSEVSSQNKPEKIEVKDLNNNSGSALDRSFFPLWSMWIALILVILLTMLSGWKIINLERERSSVESKRLLLERDKQAYADIQKELPSLEKRKQALISEVSELEGKERSAKVRYESITTQYNVAYSNLEKALAEREQAQAASQAARQEFASLQADIQKGRIDSQNLKQQVEALHAQEQTFGKSAKQLREQVAQIEADISGLERERENKKKMLEQMSQETSELQKISKRFDGIADNLEVSRNAAGEAIKSFHSDSQKFTKAVEEVNKQTQGFAKETQAVSREAANLATTVQGIQSSGQTVKQASFDIQGSKTALADAMGQLKKASEGAEQQARRLAETTDAQLKILQQTLPVLEQSASSLGSYVKKVESHVSELDGPTGDFQKTVAEAKNAQSQLSEMIASLKNVVGPLAQARA
ncbi:MAG: hypothetical protein C4582_07895, partial [Desulfobacteraceae bacterium]